MEPFDYGAFKCAELLILLEEYKESTIAVSLPCTESVSSPSTELLKSVMFPSCLPLSLPLPIPNRPRESVGLTVAPRTLGSTWDCHAYVMAKSGLSCPSSSALISYHSAFIMDLRVVSPPLWPPWAPSSLRLSPLHPGVLSPGLVCSAWVSTASSSASVGHFPGSVHQVSIMAPPFLPQP